MPPRSLGTTAAPKRLRRVPRLVLRTVQGDDRLQARVGEARHLPRAEVRRGGDDALAGGDRAIEMLPAPDNTQRAHDACLGPGEQERQLGERFPGFDQRAEKQPFAHPESELRQAARDVEAGAAPEAARDEPADDSERAADGVRHRQRQPRELAEEEGQHRARIIPCGAAPARLDLRRNSR
jgi:hypothetical protein